MWLLGCLFCSWFALIGGQSENATLSTINLIPCSGTIHENVSLFKSDIYTVLNNVSLCGDWWNPNTTNALKVYAYADVNDENNNESTPVVFVARQQQDGIVSWTIPLQPYGFTTVFYHVNRTLCPIPRHVQHTAPLLYIDVFSSSVSPVNYSISIEADDVFEIKVAPEGVEPAFLLRTSGAAAPLIRYVKFPDDSEVLTVEVVTENNKCAFISIQNNSCPVNDLLNTARSLGIYQTMSLNAFLTVKASEMNDREFLIIVITTNYAVCHSSGYQPLSPNSTDRFEQPIALRVRRLPPTSKFAFAIALPVLVFGGVWIIGLIIPFCCCPQVRWTPPLKCEWVRRGKEEQLLSDSSPKQDYSTGLVQKTSNTASDSGSEGEGNGATVERPYDESLELSAKVELDESKLNLSRMCKQKQTRMDRSYSVYGWNTITVGIFYALPAFQLVLSEQQIVNYSGNQDQCYYNFKCAYPISVFSAFNNIWSNIGYVLLGALFLVVVSIRNIQYKRRREKDREYADSHGVPQYFGIYYAMGIALITEGFMSAFYHICPTNANFQFDTAFMFIIGGLFLVKVFQNRHPDIHANAFIAFFSFAVIIFFTLIGIFFDHANPVVVRVVIFLLVLGLVLYFFVSFYHFHELNYGRKTIVQVCKNIKSYFTTCPMHKGRFFKLLVAFVLNGILVILVIALHAILDLATSVLAFFLVNLLYFLVIYTLQKLYYREPITILPLTLPVFLAILWGSAFWFFFHNVSNWRVTPAESRELNKECIVLGFYDNHDIWHFLSSTAMFFSFLFMLVLDDGVVDMRREDLHIF